MAMDHANLEGLAVEWEADVDIRNRVREQKALFKDTVDGKPLEVNIRGCEENCNVLTPLLKRLVNQETGQIMMCAIPALEDQTLPIYSIILSRFVFGVHVVWYVVSTMQYLAFGKTYPLPPGTLGH